jgi:exonuclease SbcC
VQQLDVARLSLKSSQTQTDKAAREHADTKKRRDKLRMQLSQLELDLGQSEQVTVQIISAQQSETNALQVHDQWIKLRDIARQWKAAQDKETETQQRLQDIDDKLVQARGERDALETAWHEGQAAILARQLTDNVPCPVCGAIHHPRPAISDQAPPSETELKGARAAVTALEAQRRIVHTEWTQHHDDVVRFDAERRPLVDSLGEKAHRPFKQIEAELKTAREEMQEARREERRVAQLKQYIEPLREQLAQAEAALTEAEHAWQVAVNQQTAAQAIFSERYGSVPPELDDLQKLQMAKQKVDEVMAHLTQALQRAEVEDERAKQQLAASEATLRQLSEQAVVERQRANESKQQFVKRAEAEGFADLDDYHRAKLRPQDIAHLDNEIRTYEGQLQASRGRADRAREAAKSLVKPDLTALEAEFQQAREEADAALRSERDLASELKTCDEWREQLVQLQDEFTQKEKEFAVIGRIAEVANGRNVHNITFQRFVLSALLDDVLSYATQRLQVMSRSRYLLQRAQSPLDKRKASGLDLVVSDTWTGDSKRPVETLSGGEGFYTALALALGLAEVVQAYAGGIRLDTIFVDEGFGSLDSDTLDLAIRTLENLREGGRLVGIISHVESLRERIPVRLEVTSGVNGSTAKFVIG